MSRFDPFRELDRFAGQLLTAPFAAAGWAARELPLDAYRTEDRLVLRVDLPGVAEESVEVNVDRNVVSITAERPADVPDGAQILVAERPRGRMRREIVLGDALDTSSLEATLDNGVLSLSVPVAEQALPRRVPIRTGSRLHEVATGDAGVGREPTDVAANAAGAGAAA